MAGVSHVPGDSEIDLLARAILARDRYRAFRPESFDVPRMLGQLLRDVLSFLVELYSQNPALYWLLVIVLGVICALLLTHMVLTLARALRASPSLPPEQAEREPQDFAREAEQLAARGEHLEAAHRLLLACLRVLAQGKHIPLSPEDGNGVVCRQLARSALPAQLRQQLIELILQTERAWFGDLLPARAAAPELYLRWRTAHAQLRAASA